MEIEIRLEMKNYNMMLTKKEQRYQYYHQVKLSNIKYQKNLMISTIV